MLRDHLAAPIPEKLRSTLTFLRKLSLTPEAVTPADIAPLRASGLSERAIEDAIYTCALFDTIVRVADALDAKVPSAAYAARAARSLRRFGYFL